MDDLNHVVVANFDTTAKAELGRILLRENGIEAHLMGDNIASYLWHFFIVTGGVAIVVARAEEEKARKILQEKAKIDEEEDPDEITESRGDYFAIRAFRGAVIGIVIFPPMFHLYSILLVFRSLTSGDPLSREGKKNLLFAILFNTTLVAVFSGLITRLLIPLTTSLGHLHS